MLSVHIEKEFRTAGTPSFQLKISEEFSPGFTVLFGPSGAGKSTLLDCIAGLLKPDRGMIKFGEEIFFDADKADFRCRRKSAGLGMCFSRWRSFRICPWRKMWLTDFPACRLRSEPARMERILEHFTCAAIAGAQAGRTFRRRKATGCAGAFGDHGAARAAAG